MGGRARGSPRGHLIGAVAALAAACALVVAAPASARPQLGFNDTPETFATDAAAAAQAGATIARLPVSWELTEPTPGDYDWTDLDAAVHALDAQGIKVLFALSAAPEWAAPGCESTWFGICPPGAGFEGDYVRFGVDLLSRYPGTMIESWNEPDIDLFGAIPTRRIAILTRMLYRAAPGRVIGPAGSPGNPAQFRYTRHVYERLSRRIPMALHLYPRSHLRGVSLAEDWKRAKRIARGRAVWVTEIGFADSQYGLGGQARLVSSSYRFLYEHHARAIVFHRLRDVDVSWNEWLSSLGVLAFDGTPKPAYAALARAVRRERRG